MTTDPTSSDMVRVSKNRLRAPSFIDDSEIIRSYSPATAGQSSTTAAPAPDDMALIPTDMDSKAFFLFLGFNETTATHLFDTWSENSHPSGAQSTLEVALRYLRESPYLAEEHEGDWASALDQVGVDDELKSLVLSPFDVLGTAGLRYWLLDVCDMRARALDEITMKSVERVEARWYREATARS